MAKKQQSIEEIGSPQFNPDANSTQMGEQKEDTKKSMADIFELLADMSENLSKINVDMNKMTKEIIEDSRANREKLIKIDNINGERTKRCKIVDNFKIIENSDEKPEIKHVEEQVEENINMNHHNFKIMEILNANKPDKEIRKLDNDEFEVIDNCYEKSEIKDVEEQVKENKNINQNNFKIMENLKENKLEKENENLINVLEVMKNDNKTKPEENESDKQEEEQDEEQKIQNILVVFGFFSKHPPSPRIILWKCIRWK